jgi:hypothetical protein
MKVNYQLNIPVAVPTGKRTTFIMEEANRCFIDFI